jgi:two-component sensor histidine kinase
MAIMHETLYQSEYLAEIDLVDYMQRLANHLVRSYQADPQSIAIQIDIGHISLSTDTAIQCGLIVNELVSNSLKHAFPTDQAGEISITMQRERGDRVILTISDNGVGLPPDILFPGTESLGLQLVTMLIQQLEGKVEVERDGGTTFKIQFSASSQ